MVALNSERVDTDCSWGKGDYPLAASPCSSILPDYSLIGTDAIERFNTFFAIEKLPQLPFYDTPHSARFSGSYHKKVQIKRRILEYQAKH